MEDLVIARAIREMASRSEERSDLEFGPVAEETIATVEHELGVVLPNSFRTYLRHFAGGLLIGYEIFGVRTEASSGRTCGPPGLSEDYNVILDIVQHNRTTQEDIRRDNMPTGLVMFTTDGGDYHLFLDTSQMNETGECPVVVWGPGALGLKVADDFLEYVRMLAEHTNPY